jgi:hypothetical protein
MEFFFAWLALHNKILTADNMVKRKWDCNPIFLLCYCQPETVVHLLTECNFSKALWQTIANPFGLPVYSTLVSKGNPVEWVWYLTSEGIKQMERIKVGTLCTFWWNI